MPCVIIIAKLRVVPTALSELPTTNAPMAYESLVANVTKASSKHLQKELQVNRRVIHIKFTHLTFIKLAHKMKLLHGSDSTFSLRAYVSVSMFWGPAVQWN